MGGVGTHRKRIGVLTGGGDCPGLNPVIRALVKRGLKLGWEMIGIRDSFRGLLSTPYSLTTLDRDAIRGILIKGGTILGTTGKANPFAFPMEGPSGEVHQDRSEDFKEAIRILQLSGLAVLGGDGTLSTAQRLFEIGVPVVGVPKTIDNDIAGTEYTFGFHSAVEVATEAIDRLHSTAESHDRVMILEVMGRDCGWIALHAGIAGGADVILIPEIEYDLSKICDKLRRRQAAGSFFSVVVVAEGAAEQGKAPIEAVPAGPGGRKARLGGVGAYVAERIEAMTGFETRVAVLGHLQRGGSPLSDDRLLAARYGIAAADLIERGDWGQMVALEGNTMTSVPLSQIGAQLKRVDPQGELVNVARKLGIALG